MTSGNSNLGLRFLYGTVAGRVMLKGLIKPGVSKACGAALSTRASKVLIRPFVRKNDIDMSRYSSGPYKSYNAFFSRSIRPECMDIGNGLIAPCDSKLSAYRISDDSLFTIKGSTFSLPEILMDYALAREFSGGVCLVFRLDVSDYHRYCFFDTCEEISYKTIPSVLHTVQPIAFHRNPVFHQNTREITVLQTENYGRAVQVEVGALGVGKISNNHAPGKHEKGEEKGMFLFGGSTVILLLKDVEIDKDIFENTDNGYETLVTIGEQIGQ